MGFFWYILFPVHTLLVMTLVAARLAVFLPWNLFTGLTSIHLYSTELKVISVWYLTHVARMDPPANWKLSRVSNVHCDILVIDTSSHNCLFFIIFLPAGFPSAAPIHACPSGRIRDMHNISRLRGSKWTSISETLNKRISPLLHNRDIILFNGVERHLSYFQSLNIQLVRYLIPKPMYTIA